MSTPDGGRGSYVLAYGLFFRGGYGSRANGYRCSKPAYSVETHIFCRAQTFLFCWPSVLLKGQPQNDDVFHYRCLRLGPNDVCSFIAYWVKLCQEIIDYLDRIYPIRWYKRLSHGIHAEKADSLINSQSSIVEKIDSGCLILDSRHPCESMAQS